VSFPIGKFVDSHSRRKQYCDLQFIDEKQTPVKLKYRLWFNKYQLDPLPEADCALNRRPAGRQARTTLTIVGQMAYGKKPDVVS